MKPFINHRRAGLFRNIIRIMGIVMASFLWLFGLGNLINPTVPENYLDQNTRICVMMMITGVIAVYSLFRPYSGGLLLCACAAGMGIIFKGFFHNPLTPVVMITGIIFFVSGYLYRKKLPEDLHKSL
ncbi:MAG: hypothetical protein AB9834_20380 [Lentimicrobium sp.]